MLFNDESFQKKFRIKKMPNSGSLDNVEVREWYLYYEAKIPEIIVEETLLEEQAVLAYQLRCWCRIKSRELMKDRELAAQLAQTEPHLTLEEVIQKQWEKGLRDADHIWEGVINSSTRSRESVNEQLGVQSESNEVIINPLWKPYLKTSARQDEIFENRIMGTQGEGRISLGNYEKLIKEQRKKDRENSPKNGLKTYKSREIDFREI